MDRTLVRDGGSIPSAVSPFTSGCFFSVGDCHVVKTCTQKQDRQDRTGDLTGWGYNDGDTVVSRVLFSFGPFSLLSLVPVASAMRDSRSLARIPNIAAPADAWPVMAEMACDSIRPRRFPRHDWAVETPSAANHGRRRSQVAGVGGAFCFWWRLRCCCW